MAYTTAEKVQEELLLDTAFSGSTTPSLSTVTDWIEQSDSLIDGETHQSFSATAYTDFFDYDGSRFLYLDHSPVLTVSSVSENTNGDNETPNYTTKTA